MKTGVQNHLNFLDSRFIGNDEKEKITTFYETIKTGAQDKLKEDVVEKTKKTAALYFKDVTGERPYELWKSFDKNLANDLSLFITGQMYAREKIPHPTRQLVTVAALTVLSRPDELKLHIQAALNVGCKPEEIAEVIFQTCIYGGVPATNSALKVLKTVLEEKGLWPIS